MNKPTELEIVEAAPMEVATPQHSSLSILDAAVRGGVNKENVEVVERLVALRRDELREQAKAAFSRAFIAMRRDIARMNIYADMEAKNDGRVAYVYASEEEISRKLDPILDAHGFAMLPGQRQEGGLVTVSITLIHEGGHQETKEYSVHPGATNRMKDATAVDTGATTSAWRHLVIKMFGLKSRIRDEDDARNVGDQNEKVTPQQADELERRAKETNSIIPAFLKCAGPTVTRFADIPANKYAELDGLLSRKERAGK